MRVVLAALLILGFATAPASAVERFRLGARFGGTDVLTEWVEISPGKIAIQSDLTGGTRFWDTKVELAGPVTARRIEGRMFPKGADQAGTFVAERVGDTVRLKRLVHDQPAEDSTEEWPADAIFLPRGLLGYELVIREARARKISERTFTWIDPEYRTQKGRLTFTDPYHVRFDFDEASEPPDEFVVDDEGRITGGEMGIGPTVYRGDWLPEAKRPRSEP